MRQALKEVLSTVVFPGLGGAALTPFVPLFMAHICSAMTHLSSLVRADALGFLGVLVDYRSDLVAASYLTPVLQHYLDLLSRSTRGRSITAGSLSQLHSVSSGLEHFLKTISKSSNHNEAVRDDRGECRSVGALRGGRIHWQPQERQKMDKVAVEVAGCLVVVLLDCWLECGGNQLVDPANAECAAVLLRCCHLLMMVSTDVYQPIGDTSRKAIMERVLPFFPLSAPNTMASKLEEHLCEINIAAAQLILKISPMCDALLDWNVYVMTTGNILVRSDSNARRTTTHFTRVAYKVAIRGVSEALAANSVDSNRRQHLLDGVWSLWKHSSPKSSVRQPILELWRSIIRSASASASLSPHCLNAIPQFLWELGSTHPRTTEAALKLLLDASRFLRTGDLDMMKDIDAVIAQVLASLFCFLGPQKDINIGPLHKLDEELQSLLIDAFQNCPSCPDSVLTTAALVAVSPEYYGTAIAERLVYAVSSKSGACNPSAYLGMVVTILGLHKHNDWERRKKLVGCACRAALGLVDPTAAIQALTPTLLSAWTSAERGSTERKKIAHGIVSLYSAASDEDKELELVDQLAEMVVCCFEVDGRLSTRVAALYAEPLLHSILQLLACTSSPCQQLLLALFQQGAISKLIKEKYEVEAVAVVNALPPEDSNNKVRVALSNILHKLI